MRAFSFKGFCTNSDLRLLVSRTYATRPYEEQYEYDFETGDLLSSTNPLGETTSYTYDGIGNRQTETDARGITTKYTYNPFNLPKTKTIEGSRWRYHYDKMGRKVGETMPEGGRTAYYLDARGRTIEVYHPNLDGKPEAVASILRVYNALDQLVSETDTIGTTRWACNIRNQPTLTVYPDQTTERFRYSLEGYLVEKKTITGATIHYENDGLGRAVREAIYSPEGEFLSEIQTTYQGMLVASQIDAGGIITSYRYDGAGRLIEEQIGKKHATYTYDSLGRQATQTHWLEDGFIVSAWLYDNLDRIIEEKTYDHLDQTTSHNSYQYDEAGNCTTTTTHDRGQEYSSHTQYDERNRLTKTLDPLGNEIVIQYGARALEPSHTKERRRKPHLKLPSILTIDSLGNQTLAMQDHRGNVVSQSKLNDEEKLLAHADYTYDGNSNLTEAKQWKVTNGEKECAISTCWTYRPSNCLETLVEGNGQRTTTYDYNDHGLLSRTTKPSGITIDYRYDSKGNLLEQITPDTYHLYQYDTLDRVIQVTDGNETTYRTFDEQGNLASERLANGLTLGYEYDLLDRKTALHLPDQTTVEYTYDGSLLRTISYAGHIHTYLEYDQRGNPTLSQLADGSHLEYQWDPLGRKTAQSHPEYSWESLYDPVGNLIAINQDRYTYDDLYQLTTEPGHDYSHDSLFNRTFANGTSFAYNDLHQLEGLPYDDEGHLLHHTLDLSYDSLDHLIQAGESTYTYDPFHRRLSSNDTLFLYDGQNEIGAISNDQVQLRILGHGLGAEIGATTFMLLNAELYIPLHDPRGCITHLIGHTTKKYTAFGLGTGPSICPWQFCSKRYDPETNLTYFGRRYYSSTLGRFISPDPKSYDEGPNLYTYCSNRPLHLIDEYGLFWSEAGQYSLGSVHAIDATIRGIPEGLYEGYRSFSVAALHPFQTAHDLYDWGGRTKQGFGQWCNLCRNGDWREASAKVLDNSFTSFAPLVRNWENLSHHDRGLYLTGGALQVGGVLAPALIAKAGSGATLALGRTSRLAGSSAPAESLSSRSLASSQVRQGISRPTPCLAYETLFEAPIRGTSRAAHRAYANRYLASELHSSPRLLKLMNKLLEKDVLKHMQSGKTPLNPPGAVWHHPAANPNVVHLLRETEHLHPNLQGVLHPNGAGGYANFYGS